jgi:hypothetical protein
VGPAVCPHGDHESHPASVQVGNHADAVEAGLDQQHVARSQRAAQAAGALAFIRVAPAQATGHRHAAGQVVEHQQVGLGKAFALPDAMGAENMPQVLGHQQVSSVHGPRAQAAPAGVFGTERLTGLFGQLRPPRPQQAQGEALSKLGKGRHAHRGQGQGVAGHQVLSQA